MSAALLLRMFHSSIFDLLKRRIDYYKIAGGLLFRAIDGRILYLAEPYLNCDLDDMERNPNCIVLIASGV